MKYFNNPILVVDDDPFILRTTTLILGNLGFSEILTANSAKQALNSLTSTTPTIHLILCDLSMPDMDGIELLRHLDESNFKGDIIILSGQDNRTINLAESLAKARKLSIIGTLSKPINPNHLADILYKKSIESAQEVEHKPLKEANTITVSMLDKAIKEGELVPWFQPKIDIASKKPVGVEALMRWPSKTHGMILPDQFISLAEENNLIDELTLLLVNKVIALDKQWRDQGIDLKIALNISMENLQTLDFPDKIFSAMESMGGICGKFQLEVTESRLMKDKVLPLDILLRIRMKQIKLSIDDFGTGYSNFTHLNDLPFDELKLDRQFVQKASTDKHSRIILESCVDIAKKLKMLIVAEGIESLQDWEKVEQLGCDQAQGYLIARPMPGNEIPQWLAAWHEQRSVIFEGALSVEKE